MAGYGSADRFGAGKGGSSEVHTRCTDGVCARHTFGLSVTEALGDRQTPSGRACAEERTGSGVVRQLAAGVRWDMRCVRMHGALGWPYSIVFDSPPIQRVDLSFGSSMFRGG